MNQIFLKWFLKFEFKFFLFRLTDSACIQKYGINAAIDVCAGETGGNKDTCQVSNFKVYLE